MEVADALGVAGTGFDQWKVSGIATFAADTTPNARFTIALLSFGAGDLAANFDPASPYRWVVLSAGQFADFTAEELALDTGGWKNATHGGGFALSFASALGRDELAIVYAPVPEPMTWLLMALGCLLVATRCHARNTRRATI